MTQKQLIEWGEYFYYDESSPSGLRWKVNRYSGRGDSIISAEKGQVAGTKVHDNRSRAKIRWSVRLNNVKYAAHDIVWELHGNIKPTDAVIDHLNGDPFDNRIGNLLCKSFRHNLQNKKKYENNSSGVSGVSWTVRGTITYAVAFWNTDEGKTSKNFSVKKLGLLPAFRDAVIHRRCAIKTMNVVNGTMYTDRHGI